MPQYRYIGPAGVSGAPGSQILDTPYSFTKFGQLVEMPEELYLATFQRIALVPAKEFDELGFTQGELGAWGFNPGSFDAPEEWKTKHKQALLKLHENRTLALTPAFHAPAVPTEPESN